MGIKHVPINVKVSKSFFAYELIIEITRKCNMFCDHCLRGEAQNIDINTIYINNNILDQINNISTITFTGGEPSLYPEAMLYTLEYCKRFGIRIDGFYIATNGLSISEKFVVACLKWYAYCDSKDRCIVDLSNDIHHISSDFYDDTLLRGTGLL